jgi:alkaline phosphatase D
MLSPLPGRAVLCAALAALLLVSVSNAWAQSDVPLTRIAFGSCADEELPQPIWDAVIDYKPEVFLFAGDNVYGDVTSAELTELREAYARARGIDGYMQVRERECPACSRRGTITTTA